MVMILLVVGKPHPGLSLVGSATFCTTKSILYTQMVSQKPPNYYPFSRAIV